MVGKSHYKPGKMFFESTKTYGILKVYYYGYGIVILPGKKKCKFYKMIEHIAY